MMCYKDKTFCPYGLLCKKGYTCDRVLTEKIKEEANKVGLPIMVYDEFPDCFTALWGSE
jgi:hypothetical protein